MNYIKLKFNIILLYIVAFLAIIAILIQWASKEEDVSLRPLYQVPDSIVAHFELKEKYYVVNFFASWCRACVAEHDNLMKLRKISKAHIYGIAVNDDKQALNNMLKKHGNPFKKVSLTFSVKNLHELELSKIPRTLVIYNNQVVYDHSGEINATIFSKKLLPVIEKILNTELEASGAYK